MGSLDPGWLADQFATIDDEIADWSEDLRASFDTLLAKMER